MNNKRNRRIAMIIAVLMLTMAFSTTGFAAWMTKSIEASYRNITIWVNGEMKQARDANGVIIEPFIVDGTTYVPIRGISQLLGYEVNFDQTNYRIDIKGSATDPSLQYQLYLKDARIAELEAQLQALEDTETDIEGLEKEINDKFTRIDRLVSISEIELKEYKNYLEVRIYVNLRTSADISDWNEVLDDGEVKSFIEDIVEYIEDNYDEYDVEDIEGFVEDKYDNEELVTFTTNSRGVVSLSGSSSSSNSSLSDLQKYLNDQYVGYDGVLEVKAYGSTTGTVLVDVFVYKRDWDRLGSGDQDKLMDDIIDDVLDDFPKVSIDGVIIDDDTNKTLDTFKY